MLGKQVSAQAKGADWMFMWRYGTRHPLVLLARELAERKRREEAERAAAAKPAASPVPSPRPGG